MGPHLSHPPAHNKCSLLKPSELAPFSTHTHSPTAPALYSGNKASTLVGFPQPKGHWKTSRKWWLDRNFRDQGRTPPGAQAQLPSPETSRAASHNLCQNLMPLQAMSHSSWSWAYLEGPPVAWGSNFNSEEPVGMNLNDVLIQQPCWHRKMEAWRVISFIRLKLRWEVDSLSPGPMLSHQPPGWAM